MGRQHSRGHRRGRQGWQKLVLLYNAVVAKAAVDDQVTNSATANYNGGADSEAATTVVKLGFFTMKKIDKQHNGIGGACSLLATAAATPSSSRRAPLTAAGSVPPTRASRWTT